MKKVLFILLCSMLLLVGCSDDIEQGVFGGSFNYQSHPSLKSLGKKEVLNYLEDNYPDVDFEVIEYKENLDEYIIEDEDGLEFRVFWTGGFNQSDPYRLGDDYENEQYRADNKYVIWIAKYLYDHYDFEDGAYAHIEDGAAKILNDAGCHKIVDSHIEESDDDVYCLYIKDEEDNEFYFSISIDGYIGPVMDGNGEYVYTPVE